MKKCICDRKRVPDLSMCAECAVRHREQERERLRCVKRYFNAKSYKYDESKKIGRR